MSNSRAELEIALKEFERIYKQTKQPPQARASNYPQLVKELKMGLVSVTVKRLRPH